MTSTIIIMVTIATMLTLLFLGNSVFICLGGAGVVGLFLNGGFGALSILQTTVFGSVARFSLVAIPLFMLMGEVIFRSGIGEDLFNAMSRLLHRFPGGLAIATVFASAVFGAMCGISIAAVASIGVVALPQMLKRGYDPKLAAGAICAPGALSMLIPPSILFILYGEVASVSVAKLFAAGILPGLLMAFLMALYIFIMEVKSKKKSEETNDDEPLTLNEFMSLMKGLWAPILLIIIVLGSIYAGIATPSESAGIGCVGAYSIALIYRRLNWTLFRETLRHTARTSCMILSIFIGAVIFIQFLNILHVPEIFAEFITSMNVSPWVTMLLIMFMLLVLGMFLDGGSMVLVTTPILLPTVLAMGWDPIWFGVLMIANINIAVITPPVGLNLYTLASVTKDVDIKTILKGTMPYVLVELVALLILIIFPQISLWLPSLM